MTMPETLVVRQQSEALTDATPVEITESRRSRRRFWLAVAGLMIVGAAVRLSFLDRTGLWGDEFFSLAIATGHSLEHHPTLADPALGDFIEYPDAQPLSVYARLTEHDAPPTGISRITRAVLLSDTSPPLYYIVLSTWTKWFGTGDRALRLFSIACGVACIPMMGLVAAKIGGRRATLPACTLIAFSPVAVYYSLEGRMYAMLWLLVLATAWLTLQLHEHGPSLVRMALWSTVTAAGMVTHYFFVFPWFAMLAWLFVYPGRLPRRWLVLLLSLLALMIAPWYVRLPESLGNWRVTQYWHALRPGNYSVIRAGFKLLGSYFYMCPGSRKEIAATAVVFLAIGGLFWLHRARWFAKHAQLAWLWLLAALAGPLVFDLLRGTYTFAVSRYASTGALAVCLLASLGFGRLPNRWRRVVVLATVLTWIPGLYRTFLDDTRAWQPFRQVAQRLTEQVKQSDVVIVHSIPSGAIGLARSMKTAGVPADWPIFAAWVGQLHQRRMPADLESLIRGRRRVWLVKIHEVEEPVPQEAWLRQHARLVSDEIIRAASIHCFSPQDENEVFR
jgi:hypothetical protein